MGPFIRNPKLLTLIAGMGMIGSTLHAQPCVKVKGYVNAPEEIKQPVRITVLNENGELIWQKRKQHPGMKFKLPAGSTYAITFEQPGSLTKTVEIDTRHAVRTFTKRKIRPLSFEVIMEPKDPRDLRYAGPVGKIDFSQRTGRMDIDYDYSMERLAEARRNEDPATAH